MEPVPLSPSRSRRRGVWLAQVLVLAALYFGSGYFGLAFANYQENATLVWPPTGLSLAALLLFGLPLWPGVFLGTVLLNFATTPLAWLPALGIATGNTLEALIGAAVLTRVLGFRTNLERIKDVSAFLAVGVLGCTAVSATIGVSSLLASGGVTPADYPLVWAIWWLGDMGGALVLTPVLLTLRSGAPPWRTLFGRVEYWVAHGLLVCVSVFAFSGLVSGIMGFAACVSPFPLLVWAGTRLGPRGATMASFIIILTATLATASNSGPFVLGTTTEAIALLWAYSMFIGMTALTLAAVIEQRDAAERRYRSGEAGRLRAEQDRLLLLERERLTREMHDGLGGQLVSLLSMVERDRGTPREVAEGLRRALDEIRIVIDSLDPSTRDLPTSLGMLRTRLEPLLRRNGIDLSWHVDDVPGLQAFAPDAALHMLRIIQEAVTNVLRHASADRVEVSVVASHTAEGHLSVAVRDNGCGLPRSLRGGRGIRNMRDRAKALGAAIRIERADAGTQVVLNVPVPR